MGGFRLHISSGRGTAPRGLGGKFLKVVFSLLVALLLLIILIASATVLLVAIAGGLIAFLAFMIRRTLKGGSVPAARQGERKHPAIREALPACPHCGAGLSGRISGAAGTLVTCPGCGKEVRESDVLYSVDSG